LAALFGLPVTDPRAIALIRQCTGRTKIPTVPAHESLVIKGRRAGGSIIAALIAVYLSCFRTYRLAPGEAGVGMIVTPDKAQGRIIKNYISALLHQVSMLEALIVNETKTAIELSNNIRIEIVHRECPSAARVYRRVCDS